MPLRILALASWPERLAKMIIPGILVIGVVLAVLAWCGRTVPAAATASTNRTIFLSGGFMARGTRSHWMDGQHTMRILRRCARSSVMSVMKRHSTRPTDRMPGEQHRFIGSTQG
ncbi:hypothetical protein WDU99_15260 [Microbacterium sp. Mu-80]|uniref:Uncharacterized protein n=1 Tax=Microbacterium bandirmense TaxID=3122050 RepID=A0ABU8LG98_9MICO